MNRWTAVRTVMGYKELDGKAMFRLLAVSSHYVRAWGPWVSPGFAAMITEEELELASYDPTSTEWKRSQVQPTIKVSGYTVCYDPAGKLDGHRG